MSVIQASVFRQNSPRLLAPALALVLSLVIPTLSVSQPNPPVFGDEFRIDSATEGRHSQPRISHAADGSFVVAWIAEEGGGDQNPMARRYDASGHAIGQPFRISENASNPGYRPSISHGFDGGFVVVWGDYGFDGDGWGVALRRFDSAGKPLGEAYQVNTYTTSWQRVPEISHNIDGGFVVVWHSFEQDGSRFGVHGQRFDPSGDPLASEFQINTLTTGGQGFPQVDHGPDGSFVVSWISNDGLPNTGYDILTRRFSSMGESLGPDLLINEQEKALQSRAPISHDAAGNFAITWTTYGTATNSSRVNVQQFAADGDRQGSELAVAEDQWQWTPIPSYSPDGNLLVVWASFSNDRSLFDVVGQRVSSSGRLLGEQFMVNDFDTGSQGAPAISHAADGSLVVIYGSSVPADDSRSVIVGRRSLIDVFADGFESGDVKSWSSSNP